MKKILLLPVFALLMSCTNEAENGRTLLKIDSLEANLDRLNIQKDSMEKELHLLKSRRPVAFTQAFDTLNNPESLIVESLKRNTQIIPEKSVLGGEMRFVESEILNERFIWATYEDGHIGGEAIFEYSLKKTDSVGFKLVSKIRK
ncbi:hypothetical protein [Salegentibacter sp. Hel_I_6]|uniref:hypothetical protein n=1 Tax=Salegentibacter sp. Hel_I_6 TaxID=1250278 RepID=UPI00068E0264|nr:hypothetical protein [Salegentibacter sp. Hel_I_6]